MVAFWQESYDKPKQERSKRRRITLPTKVRTVKAVVFPAVTTGRESWIVKKAEHKELMPMSCVWRRLLKITWTVRSSNQSILRELNPEYLSDGLMLKRKLQYFGHLMQTADIGKVPDAGKYWGQEKRVSEDEMAAWHHESDGHELGQTLGDGDGQGGLACWSPWGQKELDTTGWLNKNNNVDKGHKRCCLEGNGAFEEI